MKRLSVDFVENWGKLEANYTGGLDSLNGLANGFGKAFILDAADNLIVIIGNFRNGTLEGQGSVENLATGFSYDGNFVNGIEDGIGTEITAGGHTYVGEFSNGKRHGFGNRTNGQLNSCGNFTIVA